MAGAAGCRSLAPSRSARLEQGLPPYPDGMRSFFKRQENLPGDITGWTISSQL
jgi:hypothetical protein